MAKRVLQLVGSNAVETATIFRLPPEIWMNIFAEAQLFDAIALALSCKKALQLSALSYLQVPEKKFHQASWSRGSSSHGSNRCCCDGVRYLVNRFRLRRPWTTGTELSIWCTDCQSYRPSQEKHWRQVLASMDTSDRGRFDPDQWASAVKWFNRGITIQCPSCHILEADLEDPPSQRRLKRKRS